MLRQRIEGADTHPKGPATPDRQVTSSREAARIGSLGGQDEDQQQKLAQRPAAEQELKDAQKDLVRARIRLHQATQRARKERAAGAEGIVKRKIQERRGGGKITRLRPSEMNGERGQTTELSVRQEDASALGTRGAGGRNTASKPSDINDMRGVGQMVGRKVNKPLIREGESRILGRGAGGKNTGLRSSDGSDDRELDQMVGRKVNKSSAGQGEMRVMGRGAGGKNTSLRSSNRHDEGGLQGLEKAEDRDMERRAGGKKTGLGSSNRNDDRGLDQMRRRKLDDLSAVEQGESRDPGRGATGKNTGLSSSDRNREVAHDQTAAPGGKASGSSSKPSAGPRDGSVGRERGLMGLRKTLGAGKRDEREGSK